MTKIKLDWDVIEQEFRAGQISIREIARRHGCSDAAIHKHAKKEKWKRDLAEKVRKRVSDRLVRGLAVSSSDATDDELVEAAAERGAEVVALHRADINALRDLEQRLIAEIDGEPTKLYITQYQGKIVEKVVGLTAAERCAAAANLAQVQHKRIALERQAFSLDESDVGSGRIMVEID